MKVRLVILGAVSATMLAFVGTAGATDVHAVRHATDVMAVRHATDVMAVRVTTDVYAVRGASSSWTGRHPGSSTWNSFRPLGEKWGSGGD
jgi:hypothetical protein